MIVDGLATAIINFILFGIVVAIRRSFNNEGLDSFLIHTDRRGMKLFLEGIIVGMVLIIVYSLLVIMLGFGEITFNATEISNTFISFISNGIGFLAVALFEEALFRSYIFFKLARKVSLISAMIISSVIFGGLHFMPYAGVQYIWIGLINASLIGVLLCVIVIQSGSLMLAIGYHLAWDLSQKLILSKANSAIKLSLEGNILTGVGIIPEAGFIITVVLMLMAVYIFIRFKYIKQIKCKEKDNNI
jgi:membrane protease YdiL (CAAX protease family)